MRNLRHQIKRQKSKIGNGKATLLGRTFLIFDFCLLIWCLPCRAQGPARAVYVTSPRPRIISGETVRLAALARDQNGAARPSDAFTWRSSNTALATVDNSGMVTARGLGLVDIFATTAGLSGQTRLQILPLRIDVYPSAAELFLGDRLQYSAVAVDVNEGAIPNVTWQWQLTGANGGGTQAATITPNGVLSARAVALVTVRAVIPYGGIVSQFVPSFVGLARLEIKPRNDFRLTRLLSTADVRHSFQLRPILGRAAATNDLGQVALVGSLDGLSTALLLWENGRFEILATGGSPGPVAGGLLNDFSDPALNNRGQVLTRASAQGPGGLLLASRAGSSYLAVDGEAAGGVEGLGGFFTTPNSLNDNGDVVYSASFRLPGLATGRSGLFRQLAGAAPQRIATSGDEFPGLGVANVDNNRFGIDRDGVVWFAASSGPNMAIYRQERFLAPERVLATGSPIADSTLRSIGRLAVSATGEVAFVASLANNNNVVVRLSGGQVQTTTTRFPSDVISVAPSGVVFYGDAGRGSGLYRWTTAGVTPVLMQGRLGPNDEPIQQFYSAAINTRGDIVTQLRTSNVDLLVARPGTASPLLFQSGARIDSTANIQVFNGSLVRGPGSGPPYLLLGSPSSLFQLDSRGLLPRLVLGDRLPDGTTLSNIGGRYENGANDLFFDASGISRRLSADRVDNVVLGNFRADDGTFVNRGNVQAVNDRGALVWQAGTNLKHTRVYLSSGGRDTLLFFEGPEARWQSPSPAGGGINNHNEMVLDDTGRVLAILRVLGGPSGVFLWENGRWRPTALFDRTPIRGLVVNNAYSLLAVGDRFYAIFNLRAGGSALAEFRDTDWTWITGLNDDSPNGNTINNVNAFDVNRRGDIAVALNGGQMLALRSGGNTRLVHFYVDAPEGVDFFSVQQVELREDGRIFFGGINLLDQYVIYLAEPLLTNWPTRSRAHAR